MWSNSLILHAGVFREWFSGWFRAWEHWVPIRMDLSDLESTMRWLVGTDEGGVAAGFEVLSSPLLEPRVSAPEH